MVLDDEKRFLNRLIGLFSENTPENRLRYALCGATNDVSSRLRYVNCGHLPPLLLRRKSGSSSSWTAGSTVLGMFTNSGVHELRKRSWCRAILG